MDLCAVVRLAFPQTRLPNQKSRQEKKIFWLDGMLYQSKPISSGKKKTRTKTQMTVARSKMRLVQHGGRTNNVSKCTREPAERSRPSSSSSSSSSSSERT